MSDVQVFERASPSFAASLAQRGHHIVYRANAENHCPGCGRSHWYIGRVSAECGFCGTAVPLAEARHDEAPSPAPRPSTVTSSDQRRHPRMSAKGRKLQLLIDGSPANFALQNISEGGAMGSNAAELSPGAKRTRPLRRRDPRPGGRQVGRGWNGRPCVHCAGHPGPVEVGELKPTSVSRTSAHIGPSCRGSIHRKSAWCDRPPPGAGNCLLPPA